MIVTGWCNGSKKNSGAGYGIRLRRIDRDKYFDGRWRFVQILIVGGRTIRVNLSASFWSNCIELRSKYIGSWMICNNHAPWARNVPPNYKFVKIKGNMFKLSSY